ncbi:hypothetical protein FA15DRAFT_493166 [Coprinopsis marcescibilis]|uniref:Uncharacterized protein n=1 Tax=Coprinopsis marcescibilis TaxID=230819 RepID=A0A5C3KS18_COPMA|nr:hypothetical protein FA15DRAFT_493166 [Coprinopsis marcescibilis]
MISSVQAARKTRFRQLSIASHGPNVRAHHLRCPPSLCAPLVVLAYMKFVFRIMATSSRSPPIWIPLSSQFPALRAVIHPARDCALLSPSAGHLSKSGYRRYRHTRGDGGSEIRNSRIARGKDNECQGSSELLCGMRWGGSEEGWNSCSLISSLSLHLFILSLGKCLEWGGVKGCSVLSLAPHPVFLLQGAFGDRPE